MLKHRVIPALLLRNGGLVKTRRFKDAKYVGDPINAIRIFNDKEVDELIVLDIEATRQGREPDYEILATVADECFMPLCYGGGVRTVEQAARIFALGVEKVCLQSAALEDLGVVTRIAERFGTQAVVVCVDIKFNLFGQPGLYHASSGKRDRRNWLEFMAAAVAAGAGEIVLNVVDREGQMQGFDLKLIAQAAGAVPVPLIAMGGAGTLQHFKEAVDAGASAVAAGSMFVFYGPHRAVLITYPPYGVLEQMLA